MASFFSGLKPKNSMYLILIALFMLSIAVRLDIAFSTPNFASDDAYLVLRQAEHILLTGFPIIHDSLSFGGNTLMFNPLFYYLIAFFGIFFKLEVAGKIFPNIFASTIVFTMFLICKEITRNKTASLITASISLFIPVYMKETVNKVSYYSVVIPLSLFMIYSFMMIAKGKKYVLYYILSVIALSLIHPISIMLALGLVVYLLFMKFEKIKYTRSEIESIIFALIFLAWSQLILFKNALSMHGHRIITVINGMFLQDLHIIDNPALLFTLIGFFPLLFGSYVIYRYAFTEKRKNIYLFTALSMVFTISALVQLIPFYPAVMFTGIFMTVLLSQFVKDLLVYLKKTRFSGFNKVIIPIITISSIAIILLPSVSLAEKENLYSFTKSELKAVAFLKENSPPGSTVLATPSEGNFISFYSQRKNVADSNILYIRNPKLIFDDIKVMFTTNSEIRALDMAQKYNITYIYLSGRAMDKFRITGLPYAVKGSCFKEIYNRHEIIYQKICSVK